MLDRSRVGRKVVVVGVRRRVLRGAKAFRRKLTSFPGYGIKICQRRIPEIFSPEVKLRELCGDSVEKSL